VQARFLIQAQNLGRVVCKTNGQEFAPLATLRHLAQVHTLDLGFKELGLRLLQLSTVGQLEVNDLATLNIDGNLSRIATRHKNALIRLPLCSFFVLRDLNQSFARHLYVDIGGQQTSVQRGLSSLESGVFNLAHLVILHL
jgi:hypothetical protein